MTRRAHYRMAKYCLLIAACVVYMLMLSPGLMVMNDDESEYLILGKSLAAGTGYHSIYLPGSPVETKVPFLLPLILSLALRITTDIFMLKLLPLALSVAAAAMFYRFLRGEKVAAETALFCTVLFAFNPLQVFFSTRLVTEPLYLFLSLAALLGLQKARNGKDIAAVGFLLLLLLFTRFAAVTLIAAVIVYLALRRERRQAFYLFAGMAAVLAAWFFVDRLWNGAGSRFADVARGNFFGIGGSGGSLLKPVLHMAEYGSAYATVHLADAFSFPLLLDISRARPVELMLKAGMGLLICATALFGFVRQAAREIRPHHLYAALYLVFFSAFAYRGERYLLPVIPLVIYYFVYGLNELSRKLRRPFFAVDMMVMAVCGVIFAAAAADIAVVYTQRHAPYTPAERAYAACADWVGRNTPADTVVLCRKPRVFYLLSGRRTQWYLPGVDLPAKAREADLLVTDRIWAAPAIKGVPLYCAGMGASCVYDLKEVVR